jgi:hypothetical protein
MIKMLILLFFALLATHCMAEDVRVNLWQRDGLVGVSVENLSQKDIKVSKLFTQNPAFGSIQLRLTVEDKIFGLTSPPNEDLPSESDYILLKPMHFFGQSFYISDIRRWYGVSAKCFYMSATYHDAFAHKFGAFSNIVKSTKVYVCN